MNIRSNILFLTLLTLSMLTVRSQGVDDIPLACAGTVVRYGVDEVLPGSVFEWTVIGGQVIANYNDSVDVLWGLEKGEFTIEVIEHTGGECVGEPFETLVAVDRPNVEITDDEGFQIASGIVNLCEGESKLLAFNSTLENPIHNWKGEDFISSTFEATESDLIWVEVIDQNNCTNRDTVTVKVHDLPDINLGNDTILCEGELELDAGDDGLFYTWLPNELTSQRIIVGPDKQTYSVKVETDYCVVYDSISILGCDIREQIMNSMPEAFTPNDDDVNEFFILPDLIMSYYPDVEVEIFDRWGRRVFKSDVGYTSPWDGKYDGKVLPMDSYFYILDVKGGIEPIAGAIAILK